MRETLLGSWTNARGWRTSRRIIVFESDDWGAIRMQSPASRRCLQQAGLDVESCAYDRVDCLENRDDLEALFNILDANRDSGGNPPVFTFNTVMGNPDFEAIEAGGFEDFSHEGLFQSYLRDHGDSLRPTWDQAFASGLIQPQFHAREHLNVGLWMRDLRAGHREARLAFAQRYFGLTTKTSSPKQRNYLAAYWPESSDHLAEIRQIVEDGLTLFEQVFGFQSRSFVACNYVLPGELETTLADKGVKLIQGQRGHLMPSADGSRVRVRRSHTGQMNDLGQLYSVRNVKFEPFEDPTKDWVGSSMKQIESAFFWRTPAIISTHRVNYVSGMEPANRDRTLKLLSQLLGAIRRKWPDVEFVSSDVLADMMAA